MARDHLSAASCVASCVASVLVRASELILWQGTNVPPLRGVTALMALKDGAQARSSTALQTFYARLYSVCSDLAGDTYLLW